MPDVSGSLLSRPRFRLTRITVVASRYNAAMRAVRMLAAFDLQTVAAAVGVGDFVCGCVGVCGARQQHGDYPQTPPTVKIPYPAVAALT